eukprot:TRINITY_DN47782_c0_g1_i2.p1 TRINITY_DN47782_c0_g1~~TRINITY_DN47782_c0_g1_i2.p1  ORF type:complete len:107 (-),score=4.17 TRINITY_DN47782_c0_g1_i2:422-742(-)
MDDLTLEVSNEYSSASIRQREENDNFKPCVYHLYSDVATGRMELVDTWEVKYRTSFAKIRNFNWDEYLESLKKHLETQQKPSQEALKTKKEKQKKKHTKGLPALPC